MSDETPYLNYFKARWKALLSAFLIAAAAIATPALLLLSSGRADFNVNALWPQRLSTDAGATMPILVHRWRDDKPRHGDAKLFYGELDGDDLAEAWKQGQLREIASAEIDTDGVGLITIPPLTPAAARADSAATGRRRPFLLLRVRVDGDDQWLSRQIEAPDAPVLALSLDRPLYQPGQTIRIRGLVASATTGKPLDRRARFVVRDARSNLLMDEEVATSSDGVAATELVLADRCVQGTYTVELSAAGVTTAQQVDVRPFRLPQFKVEVVPLQQTVIPGETLRARVQATYTYGDPVADAALAVAASVGDQALAPIHARTTADGSYEVAMPVPQFVSQAHQATISATVTTATGRAQTASASVAMAGRRVAVRIVPAGEAAFSYSAGSQTGFVIVTQPDGEPVAGATVDLRLPEYQQEKQLLLTTDLQGRAKFEWSPHGNNTASVKVARNNEVLFSENLLAPVEYAARGLTLLSSIANVGDALPVTLPEAPLAGTLSLVRDGVPLQTVRVAPGTTRATLELPANAAGFASVVLQRHDATYQAPLWIRQPGGDAVDVRLAEPIVRPGSKAQVTLQFPPPEQRSADTPPVTFGLVGVDEALYALKERASVPLYVLMRRAPENIFDAIGVFEGVDPQDTDDALIATHEFRTRVQGAAPLNSGAQDHTDVMARAERRMAMLAVLVVLLLGLFGCVGAMARWTWQSTSKDAFTLRRLGGQVAFGILCGVFAAALAADRGETLLGGLSVWTVVSICWLAAAAARLPELPLGKWLATHAVAFALLTGIAICVQDTSRGDSDIATLVGLGMALPVVLALVQWIVWAFVLMRQRQTIAGLALGSYWGVVVLGLVGSSFMRVGMSPKYMVAKADGAFEEALPAAPMMAPAPAQEAMRAEPSPEPPAGTAAPAAPRVRSWFPETMVWLPEIVGDASGKATVDIEVPDSITTWRLDAWANTSDGRFGEGRASLVAIQPYFVEVDVPIEVIDGDRFEIPVTLVNRSSDALEVDFDVVVDGALALRGARGLSARLGAGERRVLWVDLAAVAVGDGSITVSSTTNGAEADAIRRTLRVRPDGRVVRKSASAFVGKGWETTIAFPDDTIEGTRYSDVRVLSSIVAEALGGLEGMLRFPDGCFEQTSSAAYPNVMVLRALQDLDPAKWPDGPEAFAKLKERAEKLVRIGYQRILTFQHPSGGFTLYPERNDPDVMLTAYGVMQLAWASTVVNVDPAVIDRAVNWLVQQQNQDGSWSGRARGSDSHDADVGLVRGTAFVVMALAAAGNPQHRHALERALVRLEDRLEAVQSANALAYAANALADAGSKQLAGVAVARLASMARREADVAYWGDTYPTWTWGWGAYAERETTALAVQAMLATASQPELVQPALNWLTRARSPYGGWGSTQATVWALRALETLRSRANHDATLRFYLDSQQLPTVQGAMELKVTAAPQPLRQFGFVPAGSGRFVVDASAETATSVQLVTEYAVDWDSRLAAVDGETFGGEVEVPRAMRRGATTRAFARVENLLETDVRTVIIEAPIPPGAFVPTDQLDQLRDAGAIDLYEVLPTHVRLYVDHIPGKQERVFAYEFVPLVRGDFSLPPLRAYAFYAPEPVAELDAGDVTTR